MDSKNRSCLFCLKIGTHLILEVLIPNMDLDFWNSDLKIHFWANLGKKIQNCLFCLKIGIYGILEELVPNLELGFQNFDPKIYFWESLGQKSILCLFSFETLLLFLYIQLVSVLYYKIVFYLKFFTLKLLYILSLHFASGSGSTMGLYIYENTSINQ